MLSFRLVPLKRLRDLAGRCLPITVLKDEADLGMQVAVLLARIFDNVNVQFTRGGVV